MSPLVIPNGYFSVALGSRVQHLQNCWFVCIQRGREEGEREREGTHLLLPLPPWPSPGEEEEHIILEKGCAAKIKPA